MHNNAYKNVIDRQKKMSRIEGNGEHSVVMCYKRVSLKKKRFLHCCCECRNGWCWGAKNLLKFCVKLYRTTTVINQVLKDAFDEQVLSQIRN